MSFYKPRYLGRYLHSYLIIGDHRGEVQIKENTKRGLWILSVFGCAYWTFLFWRGTPTYAIAMEHCSLMILGKETKKSWIIGTNVHTVPGIVTHCWTVPSKSCSIITCRTYVIMNIMYGIRNTQKMLMGHHMVLYFVWNISTHNYIHCTLTLGKL